MTKSKNGAINKWYDKFDSTRKSRLEQMHQRIRKGSSDSTLLINLSYLSKKSADDIRSYILNKISEEMKTK